ncbi:MAG: potassium transporter TrkG [Bacteroidota bacterium]
MINGNAVLRVISVLLGIIGCLMWSGLPFSWAFASGDGWVLAISGLICVLTGGITFFTLRKQRASIRKREGYLIVALGWLAMILFGMLPYLISGLIPSVPGAIFETVSGLTTTGASVLTDIEATPAGLLYWRSLTQWIGGMGIIVLTVAIFPLLGIGGIELFVAEAPGPTSDKLHPRISETAKRLWFIYVGLTAVLVLILWAEGMTFYEAVNHALTTMATGGFSTRNNSMAAFGPTIQYTIILFMFLAGTNYSILYLSLKRRWQEVWQSQEFKTYLGFVIVLTALFTLGVHATGRYGWEQSFRDSLFQIVSLITTTGFVSADYTSYSETLTIAFFMLLFLGACAGSTSGGIKIIRHLVFFKNSLLEFKRLIHPNAIVPLRLNGQVVRGKVITHVYTFLLLYLFLFVFGTIVLSFLGLDFTTSLGAMATSLGNVGPGIGEVGPVDNFAWLSDSVKLFLSFIMLLGRLELFTILVLFSPYFWRLN